MFFRLDPGPDDPDSRSESNRGQTGLAGIRGCDRGRTTTIQQEVTRAASRVERVLVGGYATGARSAHALAHQGGGVGNRSVGVAAIASVPTPAGMAQVATDPATVMSASQMATAMPWATVPASAMAAEHAATATGAVGTGPVDPAAVATSMAETVATSMTETVATSMAESAATSMAMATGEHPAGQTTVSGTSAAATGTVLAANATTASRGIASAAVAAGVTSPGSRGQSTETVTATTVACRLRDTTTCKTAGHHGDCSSQHH